ncbi:porin family protein [Candidatus Aminicenantes bacterium AH-873-B07]|nr:porin family protein [Candidatus Aminicenantes bacterium AH-873-B07]
MRKILIIPAFTISLLLITNSAYPNIIYLGIQSGVSLQKPSFSDIEFNTDTTFLMGLNGGFRLGGFGLELNYFQAAHNLEPVDILAFDWGKRELDFSYVGGNFKIGIPFPLIFPYATIGYGYYTANPEGIEEEKEGGLNIGAGLEIAFGRIALRGEGKYHKVGINFEERKFDFTNFTFIIGLNFYIF